MRAAREYVSCRRIRQKLGKASVTGYCIKFKALKDVDMDVLETAVRNGVEGTKLSFGDRDCAKRA
jgi:hypothetical protein